MNQHSGIPKLASNNNSVPKIDTTSSSGITLAINAASKAENSSVTASGYFQHPITAAELTAFGLDAKGGAYFADVFGGGNSPDEMWYTQPADSRWGDLYSAYQNITPVVAMLTVQSATIKEITSAPQVIATQNFSNTSSSPANFNCGVTLEVSATAETNWSSTVSYDVTQTISYELSFLGSGAGGETSFSFSEQFGQGGSQSNSVTLGQSSGLDVTLQPGQSVVAELTVSQGTMLIDVVYQLSLSGGVFGTFESPYTWPNESSYGSHYIWMDGNVNDLFNAANVPSVVTVSETISVGFFTNSTVTLTDSTTGAIIRRLRGGETRGPVVQKLDAVEAA